MSGNRLEGREELNISPGDMSLLQNIPIPVGRCSSQVGVQVLIL
jgi:hypothetical protein